MWLLKSISNKISKFAQKSIKIFIEKDWILFFNFLYTNLKWSDKKFVYLSMPKEKIHFGQDFKEEIVNYNQDKKVIIVNFI